MFVRSRLTSVALASILVAGLSACQKQENAADGKGPAERAGQQIDQAAKRAGEELNKVAEKAGKGLQEAGAKLEDKAQEAQKKE
ncbi:hypothetical protein [Noviherbaspirillum malthae]|jgi:hypothetical protein|uniref:hypothetical protein n=1 Tax=Noviherbaspirillum malthae TaxID=1260987 RepID=UPI00188FB0BD|nr:hypothetical protein [Noviherbaspirillum malthae]